ncbi:MAG: hypothetical protein H6R00_2129 [Proteobacteria bacterium]|nr:hypothetical protein [Pseudomonadota bacterium]
MSKLQPDPIPAGQNAGLGLLTRGYKPLAGAYDEMMAPDGSLRGPWPAFLQRLAELGEEGAREAFAGAEQQLKNSGVFFRVYDDPAGAERPWPLTPVPLLISASEWEELSAGAIQRARLAEALLADVYGPGRLARDDVLPAAAIAGSPDFLRPLVGVTPKGGRFLRFFAVDLGRGPDGQWWVLSDRAQAPSGAGYALENRLAVTRALPEVARGLNVERLAPFFQAFRDDLAALNAGAEARVGLLTPGRLNETYFEHAYLARYLGFLLVEGGDLTVRGDAVYVRTVSGLKRIDALWRRLDSDFADPLELRTASALGVPGLVQAVRAGRVDVTNALGSGVAESRALMGFMPALCRHLLGEPLVLPNLATWWCGQEKERRAVLDRFDRMAIASAFSNGLPGLPFWSKLGAAMSKDERKTARALIETRGLDVVGQENVGLSTMPVWDGSRLVPKPFVLRLFVAAVGDQDWTVMPGGFCRISGSNEARLVSMQQGAETADVWVLSDTPVKQTSLLPQPDRVSIRRSTGTLPSRSADNLYWLARYLERAEGTLRLLRGLINRLVEAGSDSDQPIIRMLIEHLQFIGAVDPESEGAPIDLVAAALSDPTSPSGLPALTGAARAASSAIRDRLAPDAFRAVTEIAALFETVGRQRLTPAQMLDEVNHGLRRIAAFAGLAAENMNRAMGWRFLDLGRRIERALATAAVVRRFALDAPSAEALDLALEAGDSQITYRWRYVMRPASLPVIDLLMLDDANPRSVAFQMARVVEHLEALPATRLDGRPVELLRLARKLDARIANTAAEKMETRDIDKITSRLLRLSGLVTDRFFTQRPSEARPEELE